MNDDQAARVRALEAERRRRPVPPPSVEDLMQALIGTLHSLYRTPPDSTRTEAS